MHRLQESMGPIMDRSKEHLTNTDNGIIMARLRLLRATKALTEKGVLPPGREPEEQRGALRRAHPRSATRHSKSRPKRRSPRAPAFAKLRCEDGRRFDPMSKLRSFHRRVALTTACVR